MTREIRARRKGQSFSTCESIIVLNERHIPTSTTHTCAHVPGDSFALHAIKGGSSVDGGLDQHLCLICNRKAAGFLLETQISTGEVKCKW